MIAMNEQYKTTVGDTAEKKIMWYIDNISKILEEQLTRIRQCEQEIGTLQLELKTYRDEKQEKKK